MSTTIARSFPSNVSSIPNESSAKGDHNGNLSDDTAGNPSSFDHTLTQVMGSSSEGTSIPLSGKKLPAASSSTGQANATVSTDADDGSASTEANGGSLSSSDVISLKGLVSIIGDIKSKIFGDKKGGQNSDAATDEDALAGDSSTIGASITGQTGGLSLQGILNPGSNLPTVPSTLSSTNDALTAQTALVSGQAGSLTSGQPGAGTPTSGQTSALSPNTVVSGQVTILSPNIPAGSENKSVVPSKGGKNFPRTAVIPNLSGIVTLSKTQSIPYPSKGAVQEQGNASTNIPSSPIFNYFTGTNVQTGTGDAMSSTVSYSATLVQGSATDASLSKAQEMLPLDDTDSNTPTDDSSKLGANPLAELFTPTNLATSVSGKSAFDSKSITTTAESFTTTLTQALQERPMLLPNRLQISLTTPPGGKVTLYLTKVDDGVRAQLSTDDTNTLPWLNQQIAQMKQLSESDSTKWMPAQLETAPKEAPLSDKTDSKKRTSERRSNADQTSSSASTSAIASTISRT